MVKRSLGPSGFWGRVMLVILMTLLLAPVLSGETRTAVVLDLYYTMLINPDPENFDSALLPAGLGEIRIDSVGNRNVRAYLDISADLGYSYALSIDRAYLRSRFENFRFTIGKTRLSWGEGLVFNAADVLMGSSDLNINLGAQEYRSESSWLSAVYFPLGRFAFLEAVVMPAMIDAAVFNPADPASFPDIEDSGAGVRLGFEIDKLFDTAVETGYFYSGNRANHSAYLSLQGGAGINWHVSSSLALPQDSISLSSFPEGLPEGSELIDGLLFSGGFYGLPNVGRQVSMNLRFEGLFKPSGVMAEEAGERDYGLFAFAELGLGFGQIVTSYVRSIISPVDLSALVYGGASFAVFQGFSAYLDVIGRIGEAGDVFPHFGLGGYSIRSGVRFVY